MSKKNSNSALYFKNKFYNCGDGSIGTDLSYMFSYLNSQSVRELRKRRLLITKDDYMPY